VRAVAELPHALFAVLEASPEIRIARLSLRGDPFDQAALQSGDAQAGTANRSAMMDILTERRAESVLSEHALGRLAGVLATAQADASAVAAAASIIVEEARYYDPEAARAVLEQMAPDRIFVIDTARYGVDDVVGLLRARLAADG
jgi:Mg2+/Co2+ transporter CorC